MNEDAPIILEYIPQCVEPAKLHEFVQVRHVSTVITCAKCSLLISGPDRVKISEIINKKIGSLRAN